MVRKKLSDDALALVLASLKGEATIAGTLSVMVSVKLSIISFMIADDTNRGAVQEPYTRHICTVL